MLLRLDSKLLFNPGYPQHDLHAPALHMLRLYSFTSRFLNKEDSLWEGVSYLDIKKTPVSSGFRKRRDTASSQGLDGKNKQLVYLFDSIQKNHCAVSLIPSIVYLSSNVRLPQSLSDGCLRLVEGVKGTDANLK